MTWYLLLFKGLGAFAVAYLFGCFSSAYVVGRVAKRIDIREHGSGNAGSTNAFRILGPVNGLIVLGLDILKGFIATLLGYYILSIGVSDPATHDMLGRYGVYLTGLAAVLGHNFPVFMGFRGGKGVATSLGVCLLMEPVIGAIFFVVAVVADIVFKVFSATSIVMVGLFCGVVIAHRWIYHPEMLPMEHIVLTVYMAILFLLVVYMHRENIGRLMRGRETKTDIVAIFKKFNHKNKEIE